MLKHWKVGLVYAAFGSLFTIVGMIVSNVTAKHDKFGEIECTRLKIVDDDGVAKVALGVGDNIAGLISICDKTGYPSVMLASDDEGGIIVVSGKDQQKKVAIASNGPGGTIEVYNQNEEKAVLLDVEGEHTGRVELYDKDKKQVVLVASGYIPGRGGAIYVADQNGQVKLTIDNKQYLGEEIVCKSLRIVEDDLVATTRMLFSTRPFDFVELLIDPPGPSVFMTTDEDSGIIEVYGKEGHMKTMIHGGRVSIQDIEMDTKSIIGFDEHGGFVSVHGEEEVGAALRLTEDGGRVQINGNDGNPKIGLGVVPNYGGGYINVFGNTKEDGVIISATENGGGGFVNVYRDDRKKQAWLYINDQGKGDVYTSEDSQ